jgi:hypothetical protein
MIGAAGHLVARYSFKRGHRRYDKNAARGIHSGEDFSAIAEHLKKVAAGAGETLRVDPAPE